LKKTYLVYAAYPYTRDPERTTKEISAKVRHFYELYDDLLFIVPHLAFDALWDFPKGYSHPEVCLLELALISKCDIFAYDPANVGIGVNWEKSCADLLQIPVLTYDELESGNRPQGAFVNPDAEIYLQKHLIRFRKIFRTPSQEQPAGIKFDQGKIMVDLIVPEFIEDLAKVLTMGAQKYGVENWKGNLEKRRILAALYRHLLKYHKGETYDDESKLNHLCHVAINAMFLYWYDECQKKVESKKE
jgi:hypothetical protein